MSKRWNPRYLAYARAHGAASPEEMIERDREEWRGGVMIGFMFWIQEKWRQWYKSLGPCNGQYACRMFGHKGRFHQDHAAFDAWLQRSAPSR